jgi:hypothetical protein
LHTALDPAMTEHLGDEKGDRTGPVGGNHRNRTSAETVQTEVG